MTPRLLPVALAALSLALAPAATAQSEKQVLADYKHQVKSTLTAYKHGLALAAVDLDAALQVFEVHFDDLPYDDGPVEDLVAALQTYQDDVYFWGLLISSGIGLTAKDALAQLPDGGADDDVYPSGLLCGDGGTLDDALAKADQIARKANAAVLKKLGKLEQKLRKQSDVRLSIFLAPESGWTVAPSDGSYGGAHKVSLVIDVLVGFNRGGSDDDGRLWVGGFTDQVGAADLTVTITGPTPVAATFPASNQRWLFATDVEADPLVEGNYTVFAAHGNGAFVNRTIGLP